jgi:hypothetical protein
MLNQSEKKSLFSGFGEKKRKPTISPAQKKHRARTKKAFGIMKKNNVDLKTAWDILKKQERVEPVKNRIRKPTVKKSSKKEKVKVDKPVKKRKPKGSVKSSKEDLTPAQKRAKRAMKLAHTKYKNDKHPLKKAWAEIKKK